MLLHVLADQALSLQRDAFYHPSHLPKPGLLLESSLVSVAVTKHQSKSTWKGLFGYFWFPVHHHGNSSRREVGTGRDAASGLASYTLVPSQPRPTSSGMAETTVGWTLHHLVMKKMPPQKCPQISLMEASPQLRFPFSRCL